MIEIKEILTRKERFLLRELTKCVHRLAKFISSEGISQHDVNTFFMQSVFETCLPVTLRNKKLSQEFSSETEEETNSEISDRLSENLEITLEKAITTKLESGETLQKILLSYAEKCCEEEEKLRNYLLSEEEISIRSVEFKRSIDFEKIRDRIQHKNYISRMDLNESSIRYEMIGANEPSLEDVYSLGSRYEAITPRRRRIDDSESELNYMHSFERSLAESIKKTKLLRSMLEKQLSFERSDSNFNDNEEEHSQEKEIY